MSRVLNLEFCDHLAGTTWKGSWFDALSEALLKLVTTCRQIEEGTYELRGRLYGVQEISKNTWRLVGLVYTYHHTGEKVCWADQLLGSGW